MRMTLTSFCDYLYKQVFNPYINFYFLTDKPQEDPNIRGDAFKTLIVARLSYDATEQDLESEFGRFGPIERVCSSQIHKLCYLLLLIYCR